MGNLRKIEFKNKQKNWVSADSKYVITTDDVNEIKEVVNALVDEVANIYSFTDLCKWLMIQIPEQSEAKYLIVELADNKDFVNSQIYSSSLANATMYMFVPESGTFVKIKRVTPDMSGKIALVDISMLDMENPVRKYYLRYRFSSHAEDVSKIFGMMVGALATLPPQSDFLPYQLIDEDPLVELTNVRFTREAGSAIKYSIVLEYADGTEKDFNSRTMLANAAVFNEENSFNAATSGKFITIDSSSFTSDGKKFILVKITDDSGKIIFKPLVIDVDIDASSGFRTDLSSVNSVLNTSFLILNDLDSGAVEVQKGIITSDKISFSNEGAKSIKSWPDGSFDVVTLNEKIEKGVKISPEKIVNIKIIDSSTNEELGAMNVDTSYSFSVKAIVLRDGVKSEVVATGISSASIEGFGSSDVSLNAVQKSISVSSRPRTTLLGKIDLTIEADGLSGYFEKPLSILGYSLDTIEISGDDRISDSDRHSYDTTAYLENGRSFHVAPSYSVTVENQQLASKIHYDVDSNGDLRIWSDNSLYDISLTIDATYTEPDYPDESASASKVVVVEGGFDTTVSGKIVSSVDGQTGSSINFSNIIRISVPAESISSDTVDITRTINSNLTVTESFFIAVRDIWVESPMTINKITAILITSNDSEYRKELVKIGNAWIPEDGVPEKTVKVKNLIIEATIRVEDYID